MSAENPNHEYLDQFSPSIELQKARLKKIEEDNMRRMLSDRHFITQINVQVREIYDREPGGNDMSLTVARKPDGIKLDDGSWFTGMTLLVRLESHSNEGIEDETFIPVAIKPDKPSSSKLIPINGCSDVQATIVECGVDVLLRAKASGHIPDLQPYKLSQISVPGMLDGQSEIF